MYPQMYAQNAWHPGEDSLPAVSLASGDTSSVYGCTLPSQPFQGNPRSHDLADGVKTYGLILLCLAFLAYLYASREQLKGLLRQVLLPGSRLNSSDEADVRLNNFETLFFLVSCLIWVLVISLFLQQSPRPKLYDIEWNQIYQASLLTLGYVAFRLVATRLFAWLHMPDLGRRTLHSMFMIPFCFVSLFLAFLLLFNEILLFPLRTLMVASISLWLVSALLKLLTLLHFFSLQRVSPFHFFLYFCSAEILPICLLCKGVLLLM